MQGKVLLNCSLSTSSTAYSLQLTRVHVDDAHTTVLQFFPSRSDTFIRLVHSLGRILEDESLEAMLDGINGSVFDAVVVRQANHIQVGDAVVLQRLSKATHPNFGIPVYWTEGTVHLDSFVLALLDDEVDLVLIEFGDELAAWSVDDAVIRPQESGEGRVMFILRIWNGVLGSKGLLSRMLAGE